MRSPHLRCLPVPACYQACVPAVFSLFSADTWSSQRCKVRVRAPARWRGKSHVAHCRVGSTSKVGRAHALGRWLRKRCAISGLTSGVSRRCATGLVDPPHPYRDQPVTSRAGPVGKRSGAAFSGGHPPRFRPVATFQPVANQSQTKRGNDFSAHWLIHGTPPNQSAGR